MNRRTIQSPVKCDVTYPLNDQTDYVEWFWRNLHLNLSLAPTCFPHWTLEQIMNDADRHAVKHAKDNIYCLWHGRSYSPDGKCPHQGHPGGAHECEIF